MTTPDTTGTAGDRLRAALDRAGLAYRIDPWPGALANIIVTGEPGNVFIVTAPDGTEVRISDDEGVTAYAPDEHRGWVALHYAQARDDIETAELYRSARTDVDTDSQLAARAIAAFMEHTMAVQDHARDDCAPDGQLLLPTEDA
ncbi:hypothetical protein ABT269_22415 [Streptomyces viridosporus]|uniref:hypothetical protein n=1 Tax=Streptomyces viridosporus TaxID=67581 RepID=UPI0033174F3C